jgi:L-2-hydroxyglutarate oxidase
MTGRRRHVIVIGGGILGLAVARELALRRGHAVTLLEKEAAWASHQTGRNSGVIHAGLYYKPGSEECLKPVDVPGRGCTFPDHP